MIRKYQVYMRHPMSYSKTQGKTLNLNEKLWSDISELILGEVQANIPHDEG